MKIIAQTRLHCLLISSLKSINTNMLSEIIFITQYPSFFITFSYKHYIDCRPNRVYWPPQINTFMQIESKLCRLVHHSICFLLSFRREDGYSHSRKRIRFALLAMPSMKIKTMLAKTRPICSNGKQERISKSEAKLLGCLLAGTQRRINKHRFPVAFSIPKSRQQKLCAVHVNAPQN